MPFVDYPGYSASDDEARRRFLAAKQDDPFPEIADALLNSADIDDYIRMTGMLYPYHQEKLKSGSYEAAILGRCIWWDENGQRQERLLNEDGKDQFLLKANSIAFVQVEPFFRLPDYIALRFNLKITHVHRGILLGTGPLVDPGFVGRLLIPLHNLTTNEYTFTCGEGLIWIEFTKTSALPNTDHQASNPFSLTRRGSYVSFPDDKKNRDPEYYFYKASQHNPIRSSIPEAARESKALATRSAQEARRVRRILELTVGIGGLIFLLTLAGVTYQTWSLIQDTWKIVTDVQQQLRQDIERDQSLARETEEIRHKIQVLEQRLPDKRAAIKSPEDRLLLESGTPHKGSAAKEGKQK